MKVEALIFIGTAVFFAVIGTVYWFTSYEDAGSTLLALCVGLGLIPGLYLLYRSRLMASRPEDDPTADITAGAGAVGTFPGPSIWPVTLAGGMVLGLVGLVFGAWSSLPGLALILVALIGAIAESRHGADSPH